MSWKMQPPIWKSTLPPLAKFLALALADYADQKGGSIFPSVRQLHFKTGLGESTIHRQKALLIEAGVLEITEYGGIAGTTRTNNYSIHLDALPMRDEPDLAPAVVPAPALVPAPAVEPGPSLVPGLSPAPGTALAPTGTRESDDPTMYSDHLAPSARLSRKEAIDDPDPPVANTTRMPIPVARVIPIQVVSPVQPDIAPLQDGVADKDKLALRDHIPEFRALPFRLLWSMRGHTESMGDGTNTLDTALRSYLRSGHTFAEAAGHFAETEHLKPEAFIRRIQSGYSHPMTPEEREQARKTWGSRKGTL